MFKYKPKQYRHKPLYKKFIRLRANVQYRRRVFLLKFKKQKWQTLLSFLKKQQRRRKKKYKAYDLNRYVLPKYYNPFKRRYKNVLLNKKKVGLFYGGILKKVFKKYKEKMLKEKKTSKYLSNNNQAILNLFEKRLDILLYRAHFTTSVRSARQLILHGHVRVNNKKVTTTSYNVVNGDIVSLDSKIQTLIYKNICSSHFWPLPPKYLQINYKTLEFCFMDKDKNTNLSLAYPFRINSYFLLRYI